MTMIMKMRMVKMRIIRYSIYKSNGIWAVDDDNEDENGNSDDNGGTLTDDGEYEGEVNENGEDDDNIGNYY